MIFPGLGLLDAAKIGAGLIVGAALVYYPAKWIGKSEGLAEARAATLQATLDQIRERSETNEEVSNMGDAELCALLGGVLTDGECR